MLVATVFKRVRERFPAIRLRVFEGSNGQLDEWVSNGRIDLAVLYRYGKSSRRHEEVLFVVESYLCGPPGDRISSQPTVAFSKLDGLPLVLPGVPNGLRVTLDQLARRQKKGFQLCVRMEADSLPIQRSMASHGEAYAVHGGVVVWKDVQAGIISASRIVSPAIRRTMVLASTTQHPLSLAARETAKIVRTVAHASSEAGAFDPPKAGAAQSKP
jgi:DNA-binding transcriptional LysR family regulator